MEEEGTVRLSSKEGVVFEVAAKVAHMSQLVKDTLAEDDDDDDDDDDEDEVKEMPLPNVGRDVLEKVIEFCKHYQEEPMTPIQTPFKSQKMEDLVQPWYNNFVKVEQSMLFDMVAAANFMDIKPLLDLTCLAVAILIKGKPAAELRHMFSIQTAFTPQEEEQARRENEAAQAVEQAPHEPETEPESMDTENENSK